MDMPEQPKPAREFKINETIVFRPVDEETKTLAGKVIGKRPALGGGFQYTVQDETGTLWWLGSDTGLVGEQDMEGPMTQKAAMRNFLKRSAAVGVPAVAAYDMIGDDESILGKIELPAAPTLENVQKAIPDNKDIHAIEQQGDDYAVKNSYNETMFFLKPAGTHAVPHYEAAVKLNESDDKLPIGHASLNNFIKRKAEFYGGYVADPRPHTNLFCQSEIDSTGGGK